MESVTKVYSSLERELKELFEDHKKLKATLSANVTNDIESFKIAVINSLEQKKYQLLADITTSEKLNQDGAKIQSCIDRLAADFAKLTSNTAAPSAEAIKAFEGAALEVKAVVGSINSERNKRLQFEGALQQVKASIASLSLSEKTNKDVRPTVPIDSDNRSWLPTTSGKVSDKETVRPFSNPASQQEDISFWLRPSTTIKVEKEWCNATSQWFKFASTMEWLTPRGPASSVSSSAVVGPAVSSPAAPAAAATTSANLRAESVVTSWKNFANSVEWYKPRDVGNKNGEPSVKKVDEVPAAASSAKAAGELFSTWAATAGSQVWLASSPQKAASSQTSVPISSDSLWLAPKTRETPASSNQNILSGWSKAAAEVSWVAKTKKTDTSPPDSVVNPLANWQPSPSVSWIMDDKRRAPPASSHQTTVPLTAVNEANNMHLWLPKGVVQTPKRDEKQFSFPTHSSDDSVWLISTADKKQPQATLSLPDDNISDWLLPSPISGLNDDQDFEIVEDS